MSDEVQIITAFGAGLLSFFSPCVLPLIPAYICFITGLSVEELNLSGYKSDGKGKNILPESILFVLGFSTVFIALGASATFLGTFLFENLTILKIIGGLIIVIFGLHVSGLLNIRFLQYEKKFNISKKPLNKLGALLVGMVFGFGWTPCVGPILGSILMLAATKESMGQGIILLIFYSLGLGIPFIVMGFAVGRMLSLFARVKQYFKIISIISGILLVFIGIGIIFSSI